MPDADLGDTQYAAKLGCTKVAEAAGSIVRLNANRSSTSTGNPVTRSAMKACVTVPVATRVIGSALTGRPPANSNDARQQRDATAGEVLCGFLPALLSDGGSGCTGRRRAVDQVVNTPAVASERRRYVSFARILDTMTRRDWWK